jgi:acyl-homoserine lactone acylase PvdQ
MRGGYEDIDIHTMEYGIKLIDAKTYEGAVYGLGFVHARDRLWHINFFRLLG